MTIINIHGFMGAADNKNYCTLTSICPNEKIISPELDYLNDSPEEILRSFEEKFSEDDDSLIFVGQSLGGWYANKLSLAFRKPCLLTNPCFFPHQCNIIYESEISENLIQKYNDMSSDTENPYSMIICSKSDEIIPDNITLCRKISKHVMTAEGTHSQIENRKYLLEKCINQITKKFF